MIKVSYSKLKNAIESFNPVKSPKIKIIKQASLIQSSQSVPTTNDNSFQCIHGDFRISQHRPAITAKECKRILIRASEVVVGSSGCAAS